MPLITKQNDPYQMHQRSIGQPGNRARWNDRKTINMSSSRFVSLVLVFRRVL